MRRSFLPAYPLHAPPLCCSLARLRWSGHRGATGMTTLPRCCRRTRAWQHRSQRQAWHDHAPSEHWTGKREGWVGGGGGEGEGGL